MNAQDAADVEYTAALTQAAMSPLMDHLKLQTLSQAASNLAAVADVAARHDLEELATAAFSLCAELVKLIKNEPHK